MSYSFGDMFAVRFGSGSGRGVTVTAPGNLDIGEWCVDSDSAWIGAMRDWLAENPGHDDRPVALIARNGMIGATYWEGVEAYAFDHYSDGAAA